jgi:transposase
MAFIQGQRQQAHLLPQSIEDYIGPEDPVRVYDVFVEQLNFQTLGIDLQPNQIGPPEFDPKAMLKLLIYGYTYGIRSSRKLERATYHNLSFMWLTGGLKPDHKTIARFRRNHRTALKEVLRQCAQMCLKLGLIDGNTLFIDGTKLAANASLKNSWTQDKGRKALAKVESRIEAILAESEAADEAESGQGSHVQVNPDLANATKRKQKIQQILEELSTTQETSLNTTDKECAAMLKNKSASLAGYNVQAVVDEKHGLFVSTDVVTDRNDLNQFDRQLEQAQQALNHPCTAACADAGYANVTALKGPHEQGVKVIVPPAPSNSATTGTPFEKAKFTYDAQQDVYVCPEKQILGYRKTNEKERTRVYQIRQPKHCRQCQHFGKCTKSPQGRSITRLFDELVKEALETQYREASSQAIYKLRQQRAEHPFGYIKRNLGARFFLLRGLQGAQAEAGLLATCFNLTRLIKILGFAKALEFVGA